jgi:nucleoside-diphosphate-sugar epimerase
MMLAKIANMPADELSSAVANGKREDLGQIKLNSYRARNNLKWSNSYNLEDGLKETLLWYKEHSFSLT